MDEWHNPANNLSHAAYFGLAPPTQEQGKRILSRLYNRSIAEYFFFITTELDEKWLLDRHFVEKRGLVCEIQNSFERGADKGWLSGDHEGEKVIVISTFETMEGFSSRCLIKWFDKSKNTAEKLPHIPVQYLRPVPPDKVGDEAVALSGDRKGEECTVMDLTAQDAVVSVKRTHLIVEIKRDKLCKMVPVADA